MQLHAKRLDMESQSCDWILQCLKNNMDKTEERVSSEAQSVGGAKTAATTTETTVSPTSTTAVIEVARCSEPHHTSSTVTTTTTTVSSPTTTTTTITIISSSSPRESQSRNTFESVTATSSSDQALNPRTSSSSGSSSPIPSLIITHKTERERSNTPEPFLIAGKTSISSRISKRGVSPDHSSCDSTSALASRTAASAAGLPAMKQEKEESPLIETTGLSKALSLASSNSALANAVFGLSRLSRGNTNTQASGMAVDFDSNKHHQQQLSSMLQGLPFLFPGMQRLGVPPLATAGLPLCSSGSSGGSGSPSGTAATSGGIICLCGIRFTSRSNMEAHKKFYCTHTANASTGGSLSESSSTRETNDGGDENTWGLLKCPQCPYTTTHKLSLNGHMNMHTTAPEEVPPVTSPKVKAPVTDARAAERYCTDCDIQFSSLKTFKVHKTHYCRTRHVLKTNKSPVREDPPPSSSLINNNLSGQPILLLPTDPLLLVPYSVLIGASLLTSNVLPQQSAAVITADGQIQPLSLAHLMSNIPTSSAPPMISPNFNISTSVSSIPTSSSSITSPHVSPRNVSNSEPVVASKSIKEEFATGSNERTSIKRRDGDSPLDLTTKRPKLTLKSDLLSDEEKENREVNTPSLTNSPTAPRNGSSSDSISGEFEGKLLATSPQNSPSNNERDQASPKSPRPASAAPSLTSPRAVSQDSPSASTSGANRSPSQSSPSLPQPVMPPIPPGFPSLLGGLDGLNSLPFPSLQYLQGLQGVSPELILKMFNGMVPPVAPPSSTPVKQGEARCNECNIIFYKEENYQVHKKHYCAARDKNNDDDLQSVGHQSPVPSRSSLSPPTRTIKSETTSVNNSSIKDSTKPSKSAGQFACAPCGIKFTSPDNLVAHQTYYCPKREGASSEDGVTKGMWRCPRCRVAMPESMQAAHQCVSPGSSSAHGWKCPCCPMLSPTAAAAQKHLETHAGIKAFRCTICGYRGNTLRGMRTHIRMHFEKRTNDLQEENFIECILENDDRRFRMGNSQDMRMNLPDHQQALMDNPTLTAAILSNSSTSLSDITDPPLSCTICPFVTPHRTSFIKHLALVHKLGVELKNFLEKQTGLPSTSQALNNNNELSENGNSYSVSSPPPLPSVKLEPEVKLEVADSEEDVHTSVPSKSPALQDRNVRLTSPSSRSSVSPSISAFSGNHGSSVGAPQEPAHHCHICNISFSFLDSFRAHKNFYCARPQSNTPPETTVQ